MYLELADKYVTRNLILIVSVPDIFCALKDSAPTLVSCVAPQPHRERSMIFFRKYGLSLI